MVHQQRLMAMSSKIDNSFGEEVLFNIAFNHIFLHLEHVTSNTRNFTHHKACVTSRSYNQ